MTTVTSERADPGKLRILQTVAQSLEDHGLDATTLRSLESELDALDTPPGLFKRMTRAARNVATRQWKNLVGELEESREALSLLVARAQGKGEPLSPEERDKVRSQLVDLVKIFPAGLIAAANSALPIPGTGLFTPWILSRMNLMPSRWREAHLLDQLRRQQRRLEDAGMGGQADEIEALCARIEREADDRDQIKQRASLLTHWDRNQNGTWDADERQAYLIELERVRSLRQSHGTRKAWYLSHAGEVFGAVRLSEFESQDCLGDLLLCYGGKTGWVALADAVGRTPVFD